jgi:hypothetical protein
MKKQKKKLTFKKPTLLEFSYRAKGFGKSFKNLGFGLLVVIGILSLITLWTIVYTYYEPYQEIALMFLQMLEMGIKVAGSGILIYYFFYFVEELLHKKEMKKYGTKTK